ncbi:DUF1064 domain-containing protein [Metabacillus fastidiosus]|uniref:DUF1064 domain-containing protein n=1 Tax=Metabacillus fastidiosus TaxID=1458 RepID=A0ABU6NRM6_9BACI|nr:DUF1064 domain-containing protein [Metabacillus fastidiosus]
MGKAKINAIRTVINGHEFDSQTEAEYYLELLKREDIAEIELQPQFVFMIPFQVKCSRCVKGRVPSPRTGNMVNCKTCKGTGKRNRQGWSYRADFRVHYKNGKVEVIDVKGFANESFRLVRKMFEYKQGIELLVVKKIKGQWKYV